MSPRAAWRLESLGFTKVYDYVPGRSDWFAAGLPREGSNASVLRVGELAREEGATCQLGERVGDAAERVQAAGVVSCLVLNDQGIVMGRLRSSVLEGDPDAEASDVMQVGPTTIRPDGLVDEVVGRLQRRGVPSVVVTRSDGTLIGTFFCEDGERALGEGAEGCLCCDAM